MATRSGNIVAIPPPPSSLGHKSRRQKMRYKKPKTPSSAEKRKQFASERNNRNKIDSSTGSEQVAQNWVKFNEESTPSYEVIAKSSLVGSFEKDEILHQIQTESTNNSFVTAMDFSFAESGNETYVFTSTSPLDESRNDVDNLSASEDVRFNSSSQKIQDYGARNMNQNIMNDDSQNWEQLTISLENDNEDAIEPLATILPPPSTSRTNIPPRCSSTSSSSINTSRICRGRDNNTSFNRSRSESRSGRSNSTLQIQQNRRSRSSTRRTVQGLERRSKSRTSSSINRSRPSRSQSRNRSSRSSSTQPQRPTRGRSVSHQRSDISPARSTISTNSFQSTSSKVRSKSSHRSDTINETLNYRGRSSSLGPGMFTRRKRSSSRSSTRSSSGTGSTSIGTGSTSTPGRRGLSVTAASALGDTSSGEIVMSNESQTRGRFRSRSQNRTRSRSTSKGAALREKLFGDHVSQIAKRSYLPSSDNGGSTLANAKVSTTPRTVTSNSTAAPSCIPVSLPEAIHTRVLLTSSVYHNEASNLWISTVNTNQKTTTNSNKRTNPKYLKAFSFHTEREARESVYANAPAKMLPFSEHPNCFICKGKFAIFRRASHCRNCGVCICNTCSVTWHRAMIPDTYNSKKESQVKVCKSCNFLSRSFRHALLQGNYDNAITLYKSGNINLRCPFMNVKGCETMFPIHSAAQGGNLLLVRWLVDVHYCPIKMIRTGNKHKGTNELLGTSKGRNILDIAMAGQHTDILRYLVKEKGVSVYEIKDLKTSLNALEAILNSIPERQQGYINEYDGTFDDDTSEEDEEEEEEEEKDGEEEIACIPNSKFKSKPPNGNSLVATYGINPYIDSDEESVPDFETTEESDDASVATTVADACIICYENTIDCVITPCGHQICCLQCSKNLTSCPVCNVDCKFIRIYKP